MTSQLTARHADEFDLRRHDFIYKCLLATKLGTVISLFTKFPDNWDTLTRDLFRQDLLQNRRIYL